MSTPIQPLTLLVVAIAGWIQREQQAAIVYLLEENRVLKARFRGRKLRFTDDERLWPKYSNAVPLSSFEAHLWCLPRKELHESCGGRGLG